MDFELRIGGCCTTTDENRVGITCWSDDEIVGGGCPDIRACASAIIGASRPEQVSDNAAASGLTIDPALFAKAEAIIAEANA